MGKESHLYSVVVCISKLSNIRFCIKILEYFQVIPSLLPAINLQLIKSQLHLARKSRVLPKQDLTVLSIIIALFIHTAEASFILTSEIETIFLDFHNLF
jgi:hypothetical protein